MCRGVSTAGRIFRLKVSSQSTRIKGKRATIRVLKGVSYYRRERGGNVITKVNTFRVKVLPTSLIGTDAYDNLTGTEAVIIVCSVDGLAYNNGYCSRNWNYSRYHIGTFGSTNTPSLTLRFVSQITVTDYVNKRNEIKVY